MASKVHFSPITPAERLSPIQGIGSSKEEVIQELAQGIFRNIQERLLIAGVPQKFADEVVFLKKVKREDQKSRELLSLFSDPLMPALSEDEKAYFLSILQEHSCHESLFLFAIFGVRMLKDITGMEKELGKGKTSLDKELFFMMYWKTLVFFLAKKEVQRWSQLPDAATFRHIKILQSPLFLPPKKYAEYLIANLEDLKKIKKPSLFKTRLIKDMEILLKFLTSPSDGQDLLSVFEPGSFRECPRNQSSLESNIPIIEFASQMTRIIKRNSPLFRDDRGAESLDILEPLFNEMDSKLKIYQFEKDKGIKPPAFFKAKRAEFYDYFIKASLRPTEHSISCNRDIALYLKKRVSASELEVAEILYQSIFIHVSCFWMQHIRASLEESDQYPIVGLISRIRLMLNILALSTSLRELKTDPRIPAPFVDLARHLQTINHLNLANQPMRKVIEGLNYIEEENVDLDRIAAILNGEAMLVFDEGEEEEEELIASHGRRIIHFSRVGHYVQALNTVYPHFETPKFEKTLEKLHQEALKICEAFREVIPPLELQGALRELFFSALQAQCYECLMLKDFKQLLHNDKQGYEELFPESLLNLVMFEVPGAFEAERPSPVNLAEDFSLLALSDDEATALDASPLIFEETVKSAQSSPFLSTPSPASFTDSPPVFEKKRVSEVKSKKERAAAVSQDSPTLEDFKKAKKFRQITKLLEIMNMKLVRTRGSHAIFSSGSGAQVVVPRHDRDLGAGLIASIYRQATNPPS